MSISLIENNYGASNVRLIKVRRLQDRHDLKELSVRIQFEGEFESSYTSGDNRSILPADTIKNTVYALAKLYTIEQIEEFAQQLINHFLTDNAQIRRVRVEIAEHLWTRITFGGKPHPWSFTPAGPERRTTIVTGTRETTFIESGIENLQVVKTTGSGFEGYLHDPFTTLKETSDRILATAVKQAGYMRTTKSRFPSIGTASGKPSWILSWSMKATPCNTRCTPSPRRFWSATGISRKSISGCRTRIAVWWTWQY